MIDYVDVILIVMVVASFLYTSYIAEKGKDYKHLTLYTAALSLFYVLVAILTLRMLGISIGVVTFSVN